MEEVNENMGFLVITRAPGTGIAIGENVHIYVKEFRRGQVRLLISAPKSFEIYKIDLPIQGED